MVLKMIVVAIFGVFLAASLKSYKAEYAVYISACISLYILFRVFGLIQAVKEQVTFFETVFSDNGQYFIMLFKMTGITYLCEFCGGICKDAGYQSIGTQVEMFGKITIILSGIPILVTLLQTIQNFAL